MSNWAEILELREEMKSIRKKVGGAAVKYDENKGSRSVDDDINDVKKEVNELRAILNEVRKELSSIKSTDTVTQATVDNLVTTLKSSTDELETNLNK